MWSICGDYSDNSSTSYYTKRGLLSGVYLATEMYMLTDTSNDFEDSWNFLDRQVDTIINGSTDIQDFPQIANTVNSGVSTLLSTGLSMAMEVLNDRGSNVEDKGNNKNKNNHVDPDK